MSEGQYWPWLRLGLRSLILARLTLLLCHNRALNLAGWLYKTSQWKENGAHKENLLINEQDPKVWLNTQFRCDNGRWRGLKHRVIYQLKGDINCLCRTISIVFLTLLNNTTGSLRLPITPLTRHSHKDFVNRIYREQRYGYSEYLSTLWRHDWKITDWVIPKEGDYFCTFDQKLLSSVFRHWDPVFSEITTT